MKAFLVLACLFGLAFYLLTSPPAPRDGAETIAAVDEAVGEPSTRSLSSWGPSLRATRAEPERAIVPAKAAPAATPHPPIAQPVFGNETAAPRPVAEPLPAALPEDEQIEDAVEWVRLTATVRARSAASVSSAGLRSYPKGLRAQVVGREDGWVQVFDPHSQERGWVYHAYLAPVDAAPARSAEPGAGSSVAAVPRRSQDAVLQETAHRDAAHAPEPVAAPAAPVKVKKAKRKRRGLFKRRKAQRAMSLGPAR